VVGFAAAVLAALAFADAVLPYPRLHITSMGMHANRRSVAAGERFAVTIRVVVTEKRDRLDELVLGAVDDCTIVGDERRHAALPGGGTEFLEVLTLEAGPAGTATISPAYLDAIDAASGKALRYSTDPISVAISAGEPLDRTYRRILEISRYAGVGLGLLAVAIFVVAAIRRPRRPRPLAPEPAEAALALPVAPIEPTLANALESFARARSEVALRALRAQLFAQAGVPAGATLADALAHAGPDFSLRLALREAEAAAFGPRSERTRAGDQLIDAVQAYLVAAKVKP
jgi:hypothetical protein